MLSFRLCCPKSLQWCPTEGHPQVCGTLWSVACQAHLWDSPGKNTEMGCHTLLQRLFPAQESNLHLLTSSTLAGSFFTTSTTWEAYKLPSKLPPNSGQGYRSFSQESPLAQGASDLTLAKIHLVSSIMPTLQSERTCLSIHTHS